MNGVIWFLSIGLYAREREPLEMDDVDLSNRIWREQRLPVHEARTEADMGSSARVERGVER